MKKEKIFYCIISTSFVAIIILVLLNEDHGGGSTDHFFVINMVLSEYVCKFAIVKQFSCGIYGQTDTEDKRYRYLPSVKIRSLLWGWN